MKAETGQSKPNGNSLDTPALIEATALKIQSLLYSLVTATRNL